MSSQLTSAADTEVASLVTDEPQYQIVPAAAENDIKISAGTPTLEELETAAENDACASQVEPATTTQTDAPASQVEPAIASQVELETTSQIDASASQIEPAIASQIDAPASQIEPEPASQSDAPSSQIESEPSSSDATSMPARANSDVTRTAAVTTKLAPHAAPASPTSIKRAHSVGESDSSSPTKRAHRETAALDEAIASSEIIGLEVAASHVELATTA